MNDKFADWYRIATAGNEQALAPDLLERRWAGLEQLLESLKASDMVELSRLLLASRLDPNPLLQQLRASFKAADKTFPMKDNDLELRVLAGSALAVRFESSVADSGTDAAALALHVGRYGQGTADSWLDPFISEANAYLESRSANLRAIPLVEAPGGDLSHVHEALEQFLDVFDQSDSPNRVASESRQVFQLFLATMEQLAAKTSAAIEVLKNQAQLRKEESDILWWMTSAYSRNLNQAMTAIPVPAACLVAGMELADLVAPPGPLPARSFLDRVLVSSGKSYQKQVSLAATVNAAPISWKEGLVDRNGVNEVLDLCPIHSAVKASLTHSEPDGWYQVVRKSHRIDPETTSGAVDIAHQIYHECLLIRALIAERRV